MNLVALSDACSPMEAREPCPSTESPSRKTLAESLTKEIASSSEPNENSCAAVKVQEQRSSPPHQSNDQDRPYTSSSFVIHKDACNPTKAREQWVTQVPSLTQTKESTHLPCVSEPCLTCPDACIPKAAADMNQFTNGKKFPDLAGLEFEARSSKDGAWYDVERILTHRILRTGETEVLVRYVGYSAEEDEWVNVKNAIRERSIPVEHWECYRVKVGDTVLCFQEREDQAIYYDARVVEILRRMHDIRGCRCIFLVRYEHDKTEERVRLRRICCRPVY